MLDAKRLGLAGGILWALGVFIVTWANIWFGYGSLLVEGLGDIYLGYKPTPLGSLIGLVYGFLDAGVGFFLLAWLYNKLKT